MKNKFKTILALLLLAVMSLSLIACTIISDLADVTINSHTPASSNNNTSVSSNSNTSTNEEKKNEEKILYSDDNFKVTYVGIEEWNDDWTASMKVILLKVENNSDQNISISLYETYINDTLVTFFGGISDMDGLKPGKKAIARIVFQTNNLGIKDASDLEKIEFKLKIRGADYSNILVETDIITLSFQ